MATRFGWSNIFIISSALQWHPHPSPSQPSSLQSFPVNVEPDLSFQRFLLSEPLVPCNCPAPSGGSPKLSPKADGSIRVVACRGAVMRNDTITMWTFLAQVSGPSLGSVLFGNEFHLGAPPAPVRHVLPRITEAWTARSTPLAVMTPVPQEFYVSECYCAMPLLVRCILETSKWNIMNLQTNGSQCQIALPQVCPDGPEQNASFLFISWKLFQRYLR